jgi:hypothetical protein
MIHIILPLKTLFYKISKSPFFIIQVKKGKVKTIMGSPRKTFLQACIEIFQLNQVQHGIVYAASGQFGKAMLYASSEISKETLQQLRNAWSF